MQALLFSYFPIALLIYLMTKKNSMPSSRALPLSALALYFISLIIFEQAPNAVHAAVLDGLLVAWTPILIITGAIFLFKTMEATGALTIIRQGLNSISSNKIAQLMIVGWAFQFLIEGASGFGTPAALAAPVLVGLGFPAVRVAIFCLTLNSVPVSFGAVGTPTWFGFSAISLSTSEIMDIAFKSSLMNACAAIFIALIALTFIVRKKAIIENGIFILLSVMFCAVPYVLIATLSYEFPALLGGFIGLIMSIILAKLGIGLSSKPVEVLGVIESDSNNDATSNNAEECLTIGPKSIIKATFPLWGTVLLLVVTRIPQLGIKPLLLLETPAAVFDLGSLGILSISPALVVSLNNIFNTSESWSHSLLYVPSILPFGLISLITFYLYSSNKLKPVFNETANQMRKPVIALLGALVFVNLMMLGKEESAVALIGKNLAAITGSYWQFFAAFLGALGSFFSGSATISNLTFSGIQDSIATDLNLSRTTFLALQSAGGAMGNMVCINNIVAVSSVLALGNKEGYILKRTFIAMLIYGAVVAIVGIGLSI